MAALARRPIIQLVMNGGEEDARVRRTARSLRDAGHLVRYIGFTAESGRAGLVPAPPLDGIERLLLRVPMEHPLAPLVPHEARGTRAFWSLRMLALMRSVLALEPALIHAHDLAAFRFIAHAASLAGVPVVYDAHELERGVHRPLWSPLRLRLHAASERLVIGRAARVITVCPSIADTLAREHRIERPLVLVNSHPRAHVRPGPPLRERLGLGPDARVVVFAGAITTGRGLELLLSLIPQLPPQLHVALLGTVRPHFAPELERLMDALNADRARLHHLDAVPYEDVIHTLWGADVGYNGIEATSDSLAHALPNKFFEYAFAGVPILTSPGESVTPLVSQYDLGRLCPLTREHVLAALVEMTSKPHVPSGRERFIDDFCWETQERTLLALYDELLAPR